MEGSRVNAFDMVSTETTDRTLMSWEEYETLGPEVRSEYIDGEMVLMSLPTGPHQDICTRLWQRLDEAMPDGVGARLSWGWKPGQDEFGPDVIVFDETEEKKRYTGLPHLAVEVLSTDRARDLVRKFAKYAAAGLPRYWVIDPDGPELWAFELIAGAYREQGHYGPDDLADMDIGPARVS
ncbi:MAG: Uma2 family endonuclease, partial [Acidimicrobiia bacterium]|nr:Uma2 family endonuclease [Acidimicrobiia bacterium]